MVTASPLRPTWASVAAYVMLLMLATLCRIAMATTQLLFFDDPESTHLWTDVSTEFGGAPLKEAGEEPGTLRVGHCNVNGLLTDVRSKDRLKCAGVREFMTGSADLIPHEVLCINEVSKSTTCSAAERCMIGQHVNPGGRTWATQRAAICLSPVLNTTVVCVAHAEYGRVVRADFEWAGRPITVCSVYAPSTDKLAERRLFFERLVDLLPTNRHLMLLGDFNCVPDHARDSIGGGVRYSNGGSDQLRDVVDELALSDLAVAARATQDSAGGYG